MSDNPPAPIPPGLPAPRTQWFGLSTPIGVFGTIMALVEIAFVVSAAFVSDIRLQWAMFGVGTLGFFGNAFVFYRLLYTKPWVLYPPWGYGGETTIGIYREVIEAYEAANNRTAVLAQQSAHVIAATVAPMSTESNLQGEETVISPKDRSIFAEDRTVLQVEETTTVEKFNEGEYLTLLVTNESRQFPYFPTSTEHERGERSKIVRYEPLQWIGQFIIAASETYKGLGFFSTPESYGLTWVMKDRQSGTQLTDIGFVRNLGYGVAHTDYRRLSETEVLPGMELEPVALPPPEPPPLFPPTNPDQFFRAPVIEPSGLDSFDEFLLKQRPRTPRLIKAPGTRPPST